MEHRTEFIRDSASNDSTSQRSTTKPNTHSGIRSNLVSRAWGSGFAFGKGLLQTDGVAFGGTTRCAMLCTAVALGCRRLDRSVAFIRLADKFEVGAGTGMTGWALLAVMIRSG